MKRLFDLLLALMLLVPATLLSIIAGFAIWWECRRSPLYVQIRVGRHQQPFKLLKLRTMRPGTMSQASHEVSQDAILNIGHWLRRAKLDELPQVWNVLAGTMSFVGPRPCLPFQEELIRERQARAVFELRPGITGIAQIKGVDMSTPRLLAETDALYLGKWRLRRDLKLLLATFAGHGAGDAVKRTTP